MDTDFGDITASGTTVQGQSWTPTNGTSGIYQLGNENSTTTAMIFNELRFAAAKSIRTSTIILASFNTIAAFATALGIFYECYSRDKRNRRRNDGTSSTKQPGLTFISSAEIYPFILSLGITVQGIIFAVAQAQGLDNLLSRGCTLVAQFMLPGLFIVPYIQLVFGVEVTLRGLRCKPFPSRGKWDVSLCMAIVGMFLLANFLVADFIRTPDFCFSSLFLFLKLYSVGCFALLAGITATLIGCFAVIFLRLSRNSGIDATERVAASRMVYYIALAIISNAFMTPFFFDVGFVDQKAPGTRALNLSMIASVVANVSGLMTGGLHLFLRSKTLSTIGPKHKSGSYDRHKLKQNIRLRPDSPGSDMDMLQPIRRVDSTSTLIDSEKEEEAALEGGGSAAYGLSSRLNPLGANAVYPMTTFPRTPEPVKMPSATTDSVYSNKLSYSLFPNNAPGTTSSVTLLPATTYSPHTKTSVRNSLKPPPSMMTLTGRHRRDSSMVSSATVQIGLRLSSVDDMPPLNTRIDNDRDVYPLDCPKQQGTGGFTRPSPLAQSEPIISQEEEVEDNVPEDLPRRSPVKDARMKTLPPVPTPTEVRPVQVGDDGPTLSPSVYSPQSPGNAKLPTPKGVGFTLPSARYNSGGTPRSPPPARPRANTNGSTPPLSDRPDWI
ncbi:RBR-type E3 ubiquitin transferase [Pleurostoma richardsiae]|uniref:RBR-type E3 ubiquitin transferase n=1 Tax=Pleurostoma richardsiae TaxID=41990 RepID=A0AA38VUF2_9PEZI|nr:RBR-type E3 ubiquitin transferase [Pleurostoma richardsiae]